MTLDSLFQRLRESFRGGPTLREIDGELPVPWTAAQWGLLIITLLVCGAMFQWLRRLGQRSAEDQRVSFTRLERRLGRIDRARLARQLTLNETVFAAVDVLKQALLLADQQQNGSAGHRTTKEWSRWCDQCELSQRVSDRIVRSLEHADDLKFAAASTSLREVRRTLADTAMAIEVLSHGAPTRSGQFAEVTR